MTRRCVLCQRQRFGLFLSGKFERCRFRRSCLRSLRRQAQQGRFAYYRSYAK